MKAIIMAAGKGTRLNDGKTPMPKVLRKAGDRALLSYVLEDTLSFIDNDDITVVTGYLAEMVEQAYPERHFARQGSDGYGTGYAVKCGVAGGGLEKYEGELGVFNGDTPLVRQETVKNMLALHRSNGAKCTMLSCRGDISNPFGRIIRDKNGNVLEIKEYKDCTEEEKKIDELNVGVYIFDAQTMIKCLGRLKNDNNQGEYYITDVPKLLLEDGYKVNAYITDDKNEMLGVNTFADLDIIAEVVKNRRK